MKNCGISTLEKPIEEQEAENAQVESTIEQGTENAQIELTIEQGPENVHEESTGEQLIEEVVRQSEEIEIKADEISTANREINQAQMAYIEQPQMSDTGVGIGE